VISSVVSFLVVVSIIFFFMQEQFRISRAAVLVTMAVTPVLAIMLRRVLRSLSIDRKKQPVILVIGDHAVRETFLGWLAVVKSNYTVFFVDWRSGLVDSSNQKDLCMTGATIEQAIVRLDHDLEAVVIASSSDRLSVRFQNRLVALNFSVIPVYTLATFHAREWQTVPLSTLSASWAFTEGFNLSQSQTYARLKRLCDIAFALAALLVLAPVFALIAVLVKLDSKGPVIFRQNRVGLRESIFTIFKFRTMRVGSEKGPAYTKEKDPRITRVGAFLRLTRLDEFPQFFNVLRGDMSLIGPRAEWEKLVSDYERLIPYYHLRHLVKPGITGWAQVNYSYGANLEDTKIKLRYDLYYVRYFSFMLDLSILAKTVFVMLFGKGR
jgi:exopolysaccharide biosynthesis polyprenyl glycosylphosphotransferase